MHACTHAWRTHTLTHTHDARKHVDTHLNTYRSVLTGITLACVSWPQVHRKEQPCACSLFSILVGAFLAYLVVLCLQLGQARQKPAQSVTLETDPNRCVLSDILGPADHHSVVTDSPAPIHPPTRRANLLNIFPNVVSVYSVSSPWRFPRHPH
jgi:hypothetical protein